MRTFIEIWLWGWIVEVLGYLRIPILTWLDYDICHMSSVIYDIICCIWHIKHMTYNKWHQWHMSIWLSKEASEHQQSNLWMRIHLQPHFKLQNAIFHKATFPLFKFWKSFAYWFKSTLTYLILMFMTPLVILKNNLPTVII